MLQAEIQRDLAKQREPAVKEARWRELESLRSNLAHAAVLAVQNLVRLGPLMDVEYARTVASTHVDWFVTVVC